jgi:hypothetical protein
VASSAALQAIPLSLIARARLASRHIPCESAALLLFTNGSAGMFLRFPMTFLNLLGRAGFGSFFQMFRFLTTASLGILFTAHGIPPVPAMFADLSDLHSAFSHLPWLTFPGKRLMTSYPI